MQIPVDITFRGVERQADLEALVQTNVARLERYYGRVTGARVLVELAGRHHRAGNRFRVEIELIVPGGLVLITHEARSRATARALARQATKKQDDLDREHRFARVAIREAFDAARRRLQDYARRQRGSVKRHAAA